MSDKKQRKTENEISNGKLFLRNLLIILAVVALFCLGLIIGGVIDVPKYSVSSTYPFIYSEKEETTLAPETTTKKKEVVNEVPTMDYIDYDDFNFDANLQGNKVGNLLSKAKGTVGYSYDRIFYSVKNKGVYRFNPATEEYVSVPVSMSASKYDFKYINVVGDYLYFVDTETNKVYKSTKAGNSSMIISSDVAFLYVYGEILYFVDTNGNVGTMDTFGKNKQILYTSDAGSTVKFVGISLSRIFISSTSNASGLTSFYTINRNDKTDFAIFRNDSKTIKNMQLENGFFYYYEENDNGTYNLCRQKYGSENIVTLVENIDEDYPIINNNRFYYGKLENSKYSAFEYNMNTKKTAKMVSVAKASTSNTIGVQCGGQYIYLIGSKNGDSNLFYKASCISTPYDNAMTLNNNKWKY